MLDIGWTELLVIAVVLIVVVGPKDLPPMLRAFGKMTANLRKMAGDFRTQFDQALREADMDDVRQTISDVQKYHPANALREAINPLREMGNEIRNDLHKATAAPSSEAKDPIEASVADLLPEPSLSMPETAAISSQTVAVASAAEAAKTTPAASTAGVAKPADTAAAPVALEPVKKPKRAPRAAATKAIAEVETTKSTAVVKAPRKSRAVVAKLDAGLPVAVPAKTSTSRTKTSKAVVSIEPDAPSAKVTKPRTRKKPATTGKDDA